MTTLPEIPAGQKVEGSKSAEMSARPATGDHYGISQSMSLPGPVYLPGVSMRNPITGRGYVYSNYAWSTERPKITPHNIKEHERGIFTNTNYNSSFYIIHPDWTSEATGLRKIIAKERRHWAWDHRPAVQPLRETTRDTYLPLLQKKARIQTTDGPLLYKNMVNYMDNYGRSATDIILPRKCGRSTPAATQMSLPAV